MCDHKKKSTQRKPELWVRPGYDIQACCTQAGPANAAGQRNLHRSPFLLQFTGDSHK